MRTSHRYLDDLWTAGMDRLDVAFEHYERSEEIAASRACRDAVRRLQAARFLGRFVTPADTYPFTEELQRARRLQAMLDSESPASGAPIVRIDAYDEQLATGDAALRDDDVAAAQVAYLAAYAALVELLPDHATLPEKWPTSDSDQRPSSTQTPDPEDDSGSSCALCHAVTPTTTVEFRDDTVRVCTSCEATLSGRFRSTAAIYDRCAGLIQDIRDTVETPHGLPWLSSLGDDREDVDVDDSGASGAEAFPDVETIWLVRDLAAVSQQVGHPATPEDVAAHGTYPPDAYRATFGSWAAALRQAGFDINSDEEE